MFLCFYLLFGPNISGTSRFEKQHLSSLSEYIIMCMISVMIICVIIINGRSRVRRDTFNNPVQYLITLAQLVRFAHA